MFQWKEVDQNELMDSKLRCVFALPPGQEQNHVEEKYEQGYDNARSQVASTPAQSEVKLYRTGQDRTANLPSYFNFNLKPDTVLYALPLLFINNVINVYIVLVKTERLASKFGLK